MRIVTERYYKIAHKKLEELRREMKRTDISASMNEAFEEYSLLKEKEPWMFIYEKLHDIEDIEEELGVDLATLFKALKQQNVWTKYENEIDLCDTCEYMLLDDFIYFYWNSGKHLVFELKDYGKTWALTKEELEK